MLHEKKSMCVVDAYLNFVQPFYQFASSPDAPTAPRYEVAVNPEERRLLVKDAPVSKGEPTLGVKSGLL